MVGLIVNNGPWDRSRSRCRHPAHGAAVVDGLDYPVTLPEHRGGILVTESAVVGPVAFCTFSGASSDVQFSEGCEFQDVVHGWFPLVRFNNTGDWGRIGCQ